MPGSINIESLRVQRGDFLLQDVTLSIKPREIFAILGQTGSGKTVLLESIAGAFDFESGVIFLDGIDAQTIPVQQRHMGIVYQDFALFPHLNVRENVGFGLKMAGVSKEETTQRVDNMLELFGIRHIAERFPGVISGGESQRVALSRALVLEPETLLLDEPFSALDPATKQRMYATMRDIHTRFDCTIVFVTHDFREAQTLADRIGIILDGRLRTVVESAHLFNQTFDDDVSHFLGLDDSMSF